MVVLLHPDFQYDPKAVPLLVAPILAGHADMTFGSRFAGLGDPRGGGMPLYRFFGNRVTTTLENLMLGSRFTDMHSGMRAYTRECLLSLPFLRYSDDFSFDSQLLVDAVTTGQRVVEVPIPTRYTQESSSISIAAHSGTSARRSAYCARRRRRGRRGRRSPLAPEGRREAPRASGPAVEQRCVVCGAEQVLVWPANAVGDAPAAEYSCTSGALSQHDDIVECPHCGMVSSAPTTRRDEILGRYADVVDENYLGEEQGRRELFAWVLRVLGGYLVRGNRLLEVGSNVGLFLDDGPGRRLGRARGIEPSKWAVETGRERFGVDLVQKPLEELDDPPGSADAIVLLDVLEHFIDPLDALRRLRPLLDDEGVLALSTINLAGLHGRLRGEKWPWLIRPHLHYFTPATLDALLREAGFTMVEWSLVPRSFHLSYVAERMKSSLGPAGDASARLAHLVDVKVPVGWLGDVVLVVARPAPVRGVVDDPRLELPAARAGALAAHGLAEDVAAQVEDE